MKKKYVVMFSVLIILTVVIYICIPKTKEKVEDKAKPNVNTNGFLTLMLEQDDGTYKKSSASTWPTTGYIYNDILSKCENGGKLMWNDELKTITLKTDKSDKCYVYFDKYNVAKITNVTNTKTTNSVTLTVTTEAGESPIQKYYFSKDNGSSYQESTSQTYTFTGLTPNTTYTFKAYAKDTLGYETNEETVQVTTNAYVNPVVNSITITSKTNDTISISVSASGGTNSVATYYYSINNGSYTSSSSNTKKFTGLSSGTTYTIKVYVKDTNGVSSSEKTTSAQTESLTYICTTGTNLATCIKNQYTSQGTNGIYYHTSSLANSAVDNSYRYAGSSPNNYVCFESTASTCPSDNLYRIIGVFGSEVKLIKNTNLGNYYWSGSSSDLSNKWSISTLNTGTLNGTYLSGLSATWSNKIATHTWYVGGYSTSSATPKTWYNAESSGTTYSAKIGLMYVSDFGYATSNNYWTISLYSYYSATDDNWMYLGSDEWTISRFSSNSASAFWVYGTGLVFDGTVYRSRYAVRPSFYLTSSTTYVSGSGTSSDPIRIN